jgi:hypothetical protein
MYQPCHCFTIKPALLVLRRRLNSTGVSFEEAMTIWMRYLVLAVDCAQAWVLLAPVPKYPSGSEERKLSAFPSFGCGFADHPIRSVEAER